MASMHQDNRSKNWIIMFRWGGRQFHRSSETDNKKDARAIKDRVANYIRLLKQGYAEMPHDADPGQWVMSDGKQKNNSHHKSDKLSRFGNVCDAYLLDQLDKADTTIEGEKKHIRHLKKVLGEKTRVAEIDLPKLRGYVRDRCAEKFRGRKTSGQTVRDELVTFRQIWVWAREEDIVENGCPIYGKNGRWGVKIPKKEEKEKFQTWEQIERRIGRGGLTDEQVKELWESLFLDEDQIVELLAHVEKKALHSFIHPMYVFTAYTGARRSEIRQSQIEDFDFEAGQVKIRERKRRKDRAQTYRFVPMHSRVAEVMKEWFAVHPGGQYTITVPPNIPRRRRKVLDKMTPGDANHHFHQCLKNSKWSVVQGFHVLRHSFGSNLARTGQVPRDTIGKWMGHSTEEMKELYQHLFPQDGQTKISVLK